MSKSGSAERPLNVHPEFHPLTFLGHEVNADSLQKYPNHFSPAGMDFFALKNEAVEKRVFFSLIGVGKGNPEAVRRVARSWLASGEANVANLEQVARLAKTFR